MNTHATRTPRQRLHRRRRMEVLALLAFGAIAAVLATTMAAYG